MELTLPWRARVRPPLPLRRLGGWGLVAVAWACGVAGGFWLLTDFDVRPAARAAAPLRWPVASGISRSPAHNTLLMFVHPRCPCSRASVAELARIMEHRSQHVRARVLFIKPAGVADEWTATSLWRSAAQIQGVEVDVDELGREANLFAANTSGQTLLYNAAGVLVFNGGITAGRGHYGANPASDQVLALLQAETTHAAGAPVYGCPLRASHESCCEVKP